MPGAPISGLPIPPSTPRSRRALWIGIGVGAVVVAGVLAVTVFKGAKVSVPDQIDGVSRITSGPIAAVADREFKKAGLNGHDAVVGLYGTPTLPEFLFVAAKGSESPDEDRRALQQTAAGLGSGGTLGLDLSSITTEQRNGVNYSCAPLTGSGLSGSACVWNDGNTLGAVVWFTDRGAPAEFASHVHDAVVS